MGYEWGFHERASSEADSLLTPEQDRRVREKLQEMVDNPWRDLLEWDVEQVEGAEHDIYRTRIGDFRVGFVLGSDRAAILRIDKREGAYQNPGVMDDRADDFLY